MPTNDGLSKAQQVMQRLKADFLAEMPDKLNNLEDIALQLPHGDSFSQVFDELYRKTHSLKGSGGIGNPPIKQ